MRLGGELYEATRLAVGALRANKTRGTLTTLGIIIGIVGVVSTMTAANGISNRFRQSVSSLGVDVLYVSRIPWIFTGDFADFRNRPNLTLLDVEALRRRLPADQIVNPTVQTQRPIKRGSIEIPGTEIIGTTDKQLFVSTGTPEIGRFITAFDVQLKRRVCILGATIRERLFDKEAPLFKTIRIGRSEFQVVGVMEKQGSAGFFGGPDFDSQIFVPITAFVRTFGSANRDLNVAVKAPQGMPLDLYEYALVGEMRKVRRLTPTEKDDFAINRMDSMIEMFNNAMGVVLLVGMLITGMSLFVGGIGVMNIMFVSVTERTREIGIRKAIGARRRTILIQFLLEACLVCLIGGGLGLAIAGLATFLIDKFLIAASVSPTIVVVGLLVSALVGVLSGFVPALRAARLNPVEALRYE